MSKYFINENFFLETEEMKSDGWKQYSLEEYINHVLFKNKILIYPTSYLLNGKINEIVLVLDPESKKTFIIEKEKYDHFKYDHFRNYTTLNREPSFFMFLIPLPFFYYPHSNDDMYKINISKFQETTYQYSKAFQTIRLSYDLNSPFTNNSFDPIFQSTIQQIIDISEDYKIYLSRFLSIEKELIKINKLIKPYYKLTQIEIEKVLEVIYQDLNDAYELEKKQSKKRDLAEEKVK